jgi:putative DNA methylase
MTRPRVLIEDWLPIEALGIESRRESAPIPGQFPKLKTLHVWWARRPLAASAGTVLASLLPAWTAELAAMPGDHSELSDENKYRHWVTKLMGVWGDPVAAKARIAEATATGVTLGAKAYGYKQAFKNSPSTADLALLHEILEATWGEFPNVIDPTAGGGSIPYEAARYGLPTIANDLNAVAASILRAGLEVSTNYGLSLQNDLRQWGDVLVERVRSRLLPYFTLPDNSSNNSFLFARTVKCPRTGKTVPLAPNWWLSKETGKKAAVQLLTHHSGSELDEPQFEILFGDDAIASDPDKGTVAGGDAISPWDGLTIDGEYIKSEAQADRMGSVLYAVSVRYPGAGRSKWVRTFRAPSETDASAIQAAESALADCKAAWLAQGIIPSEAIPEGNKTREPLNYGMSFWRDMFSPRQLLVHGTFVEEFREIVPQVREALPADRANAVLGLLALMQGKALNFDAILASWHASRTTMRSVFERHDFAFKWTYAEFEGARELYPWCLDQVVDAFQGIAELLVPSDDHFADKVKLDHPVPGRVAVTRGTAGNLAEVKDVSQTLVCIDPPYYDNVMYAELSDFFGVWEQHTVGVVWPDLMPGGLADVKNEAVANVARFADSGRKKKALAVADYEAKMQAIFAECNRVLRDDGVLTVMFTHKRAEAWDTLGMALMQAGFTIETSWPVNTESEQSLHQAKMNSAASTIMLVCRKRESTDESHPYFEDLEADVRSAARDAVERFSAAGIAGVDLLLSTYGPALSVVSAQWPVYSSEADESGHSRLLRPEEALDAAREEVVRLQRTALIGRPIDLDPLTDFVLLSWSTFKAVEFPFDEARRLALAVGGLDVDELVADKVLKKKSGTVVLTEPKDRLRRKGDDKPGVRTDAESFTGPIIDAVHTVLYVAEVDGLREAKALIDLAGLASDSRFMACVQGLVNAIPRTKNKGEWVRPEAGLLDALVTAYFPDIEIPEEWTGQLDLDG